MRQLKISNSITNRESPSLDRYLKEINRLDLVTAEEEVRLFSRIRKGDKQALDTLTKANLRFVVSVAKRYQHQGLSLPDLINEGNIGLIEAARRFDETKGFKFISYAVWWIRQSILRALAQDAQMIRIPYHKKVLGNRISKANQQLEQTLERQATPEEIAEVLEMDPEEIANRMASQSRHVSLDSPLSDDDEGSMLDILETADGVNDYEKTSHQSSLQTELERAMKVLNPRQRETLCCFFGIGTTHPMGLEDIARKFDVTVERVRQIKDKAISILRYKDSHQLLKNYL